MSRLTHELNAEQWSTLGPQSPAQVFYKEYVSTMDSGGFNQGSGTCFYAPSVIYHAPNGTTYHDGDQMWRWMRELFAPFERLNHPIHSVREIAHTDDDAGTVTLYARATRRLWMNGNKSDKPDVEVPMFWMCTIGPAETKDGFGGLQFKEVWLFWDTAVLTPFMPKDAVVFRSHNPYEKNKN